ncbi:hypothetical protein BC827DRAFT_1267052 [Russula dissimulans]|nr:hypothetical protein BC827DRAFT_1267052 [Russula dissimulans]
MNRGKLSDALRAFNARSLGAIPLDFMTRVEVSTRYGGYRHLKAIRRVLDSPAGKQTVVEITVEEFFLREYNIQLEEADSLPVIDLGSPGKLFYVPAEL